jgi:hypothetical protein
MRVKLVDLELVVELMKSHNLETLEVGSGESPAFNQTLEFKWTDRSGKETKVSVFSAGTATPEITHTQKLYKKKP